jgi:phosphate transport system permease protein
MTATLDRGASPQTFEPQQQAVEVRRSTSALRATDLAALAGAVACALSLTWVLFTVVAPFDGRIGFVVVAWALFVASYALLVSFDESAPIVRDRLATVVVHSLALVVLAALVAVVVFTAYRGRDALLHSNFFTQDLSATGPLDPLDSGGVLHAVVGTLQQIALALVITVPLGLTCALFLSEVPGRFARLVRTISEAMTALPSIVAGLFIYAAFVLALGRGKSGLAASLALSVMMLPIIIRAADVVLRLVPASLKEASLALGSSQWRTVWHVTLPTARSGLATAVILGAARGIGETSPVLLTAGYTASLNANPFEGGQTSLPLAAFFLVDSPENDQIARGFGAAATLLLLVLLLFALARVIGGRGPGQLTRRQSRRRAAASQQDRQRMEAPAPVQASGPIRSAIPDDPLQEA